MAGRAGWRIGRALVGALVLVVALWWVGPRALPAALAAVDLRTVAVALACTLAATVASAWRWTLLARRAGLDLRVGNAVRAYYRSQLLNATLPFGVVGDVDRAVRHGRSASHLGLAGRTVVADRVLGQSVALLLTGAAVATAALVPGGPAPSWSVVVAPVAPVAPWVAGGCLLALLALFARAPGVVLSSTVVAVAHALTFVVAARSVGARVPLTTLVPLALLVLAAGALPLNLAGWGPREGVAAWGFATVGLGAGIGVSAAIVHGVVTLVAVSPGLAFLSGTGRADGSSRARPVRNSPTASVHTASIGELRTGDVSPRSLAASDAGGEP